MSLSLASNLLRAFPSFRCALRKAPKDFFVAVLATNASSRFLTTISICSGNPFFATLQTASPPRAAIAVYKRPIWSPSAKLASETWATNFTLIRPHHVAIRLAVDLLLFSKRVMATRTPRNQPATRRG